MWVMLLKLSINEEWRWERNGRLAMGGFRAVEVYIERDYWIRYAIYLFVSLEGFGAYWLK
jgi:hypothetical protein